MGIDRYEGFLMPLGGAELRLYKYDDGAVKPVIRQDRESISLGALERDLCVEVLEVYRDTFAAAVESLAEKSTPPFESEGHHDRCAITGRLVMEELGMQDAAPDEVVVRVRQLRVNRPQKTGRRCGWENGLGGRYELICDGKLVASVAQKGTGWCWFLGNDEGLPTDSELYVEAAKRAASHAAIQRGLI